MTNPITHVEEEESSSHLASTHAPCVVAIHSMVLQEGY